MTNRYRDKQSEQLTEKDFRNLRATNEALRAEIAELKKAHQELTQREQELSDLFENAAPIHWVGADGTILRANNAELNAFGYTRDEYVGHHIAEFHIDRPVIDDILRRLAKGETLRDYEARMRAKDGTIKHVSINSNVMWENGKFVHTRCFTRDITNRKQVERRIAAEHTVTRILAESRTSDQAAARLLEAIGESVEWQFGAFWAVNEGEKGLRCLALWQEPSTQFPGFEAVCRNWLFEPGMGLPGRVLKERKPIWIPDVLKDHNFPRAPMAAKENLHAAFAFPIQFGDQIFGVMEFFSREIREPDESLLQMVEAIGSEVGQFLDRLRAHDDLLRYNERLQNSVAEQAVHQEELRAQNDELLEARAAIESERKRYQELFEFAPDGYLVTDLHGKILEANHAAMKQLNAPLDFLAGKPLASFVHHDDTQTFYATLIGIGEQTATIRQELSLRPESLAPFDAALTVAAVRDAAGRPVGLRWLIRDVTEQKQHREALLKSEEKLAEEVAAMSRLHQLSTRLLAASDLTTALEEILNAALALQATDMGNVQLYNPAARALEIVAHQGFNSEFLECFRKVDVEDGLACASAVKIQERVVIEDVDTDAAYAPYRNIAASAGYRAVESTPLISRSGEILGVLSTHFRKPYRPSDRDLRMLDLYARQAADLIERIRVEEALRESESKLRQQAEELERQLIASGRLVSLGELTASMAHEFNNPLGIILGFTQDLLSETDSSSPTFRALKIIEEESKRCEKIIQELLEFARPGGTEFKPTDARDVVEKTLNLISHHLYKHTIETTKNLQDRVPSIHADPKQLEQVLVNLYLNAIDAMPNGGKLTAGVKLETNQDHSSMITITVSDTGFGIEEEDLPRIFHPFFTAKKKRGLGLGLPICQRIIRNHGGRIDVTSQPGYGTTFRIFLPLEHKTAA
jgi:PAS domain S-box-containing protein